jgi:membrane protease YdiL (CAAX protease family)
VLSERTWRAEAVVRLMLWLFVAFTTVHLLWAAFQNFGIAPPETDRRLIEFAIGAISFHGAALALICFFMGEQNQRWSDAFGFKNPRKLRAIGLALLCGLLIVPFAWILQYFCAQLLDWFSFHPQSQEAVKTIKETVSKVRSNTAAMRYQIFLGISVTILAPIAEEMLFRGLLYPTLKQLGYPKIGLWGTSFVFALLHNNGPSFVPLLLLAVMLVALYEATDNLLAPIITHSFFNTANFLYLLYEQPVNQFLTRFL